MQVSLEQADVEKAIALYLQSMGVTATVAAVSFKAGRKGSGLTTTVSLENIEHAPIPDQKPVVDVAETNPLPDPNEDHKKAPNEEAHDEPDQEEQNEEEGSGTSESLFS